VKTGTATAFVTTKEDPDINKPTIDYVGGLRAARHRQEVQPARDDRHRFPGLPEEDARREVRGVHVLASGDGCVPPRQLRDGPQGAQELEPEALRARVRDCGGAGGP